MLELAQRGGDIGARREAKPLVEQGRRRAAGKGDLRQGRPARPIGGEAAAKAVIDRIDLRDRGKMVGERGR